MKTMKLHKKKKHTKYIKKLRNGADFTEIAKKHSEDVSNSMNGGQLGYITMKTAFVQPFLEAAFQLKKANDTSEPTKTQFGYHIIRLLDDKRGFAANKDLVIENLSNDRRKAGYKTLLVELKEKAVIEANFDKLSDINLAVTDFSGKSNKAKQ